MDKSITYHSNITAHGFKPWAMVNNKKYATVSTMHLQPMVKPIIIVNKKICNLFNGAFTAHGLNHGLW